MKFSRYRKRNILLAGITAILFLVSGLGSYYRTEFQQNSIPDTAKISADLIKVETVLNVYADSILSKIQGMGYKRFISDEGNLWKEKLDEKNFALSLEYRNKMVFWTDNSFVKPGFSSDTGAYSLFFINNVWVLSKTSLFDEYRLVSYILLKRDYAISNEYLESGFRDDIGVDGSFSVSNLPVPGGYNVTNTAHDFVFSLIPEAEAGITGKTLWLHLVYWTAFLFLFILIFKINNVISYRHKYPFLGGVLLFFIVFRVLTTWLKWPGFIYESELFSPLYYASSSLIPSIGDLLLTTFFVLIIAILFNKKSLLLRVENKTRLYVMFGVFYLFAALIAWILRTLVYHSGISVSIYNILDSDFYSIIILIIYSVLLGSLVLILEKIVRLSLYNKVKEISFSILITLIYCSLIALEFFLTGNTPDYIFSVFIVLLTLLIFIIYGHRKTKIWSNVIIVLVLSALFISVHFSYHFNSKSTQIKKALVVGLSNERDVYAEMQMEEISDKLEKDYIIQELSQKPYENQERVFKYLKENYLYGFWSKYDIQTTLCGPWDNLKFQQNSKLYPCFQYFDRMILENSIVVDGTQFYYVDNGNGRISYLGVFDYTKEGDSIGNKLFVELNSKLVTHVLGYPEILVDRNVKKNKKLEEYSYAFYRDGVLVSATGKFQYYLTSKLFEGQYSEFSEISFDGFDHLLYRPDINNLLVLTSRRVTYYNYITFFAYLFTIFSVVFLLYLLVKRVTFRSFRKVITVKQRIRVAFLSVFLLSLLLLGSVTVYYMIDKYQYKHQEVISEKIQSILVELNHKLGTKEYLDPADREMITGLLIKFSNVFYTDIHLYDKNGVLYTSSRNEVFNKGIFGTMMNPLAYREMVANMRMEYVHTENIGSLQYYSGYVPFYNNQGKLLAYLNLPYFTRQADLTRDISDFIVAVINIFLVLFIIGIWLTIWLSDSLTRPLAMIQQKLQKVSLGRRNEPIQYQRMDEIGALVSEYNRMLEELAQSAEMLAESERERAWREMAKQIAHEIKNPLTPMKISIQYLQKAHQDKMPEWENMIDKVAKTLIEQIDSLSVIASEFSTFARMPLPSLERVDMVALGKSLLPLYEHIDNIDFVLNIQNEDELWIMADKEHLLRMFNNLLKNSIQAIPSDTKGKIKIEMTGYPQEVLVKITDNGTGIPTEIQDKLYMPNFTTKSSGMGLGLAIVKRIVEGMNGSIRFVTAVNQGTTFFIEFPKA